MILKPKNTVWVCPKCPALAIKPSAVNHSEFHSCPALGGLTVPMVRENEKVKVTVNEREDYISGDNVQTDAAGRPVMSVVVERNDGTDCTVYAPSVTAERG